MEEAKARKGPEDRLQLGQGLRPAELGEPGSARTGLGAGGASPSATGTCSPGGPACSPPRTNYPRHPCCRPDNCTDKEAGWRK